jgi:alpha-L-fucosidase
MASPFVISADQSKVMKTQLRLVGIMGLFLAALSCACAAGIDGKWSGKIETPSGEAPCVYTFHVDGGTLAGSVSSDLDVPKREEPLQGLKLDGDMLTFFETLDMEGNKLQIDYTCDTSKAASGEITFTSKAGAGDIAFKREIGVFGNDSFVVHRMTGDGAPVPLVVPPIASGPFKPTWESLAGGYHAPEWFRDAKFGIWAHWSAQCVPEHGDWYARNMYIQGTDDYKDHLARYGHPSRAGFMELDHLWKAEKWDPEKLMRLYKRAGAKYFVALANHHDNFDTYDSKYQPWNSVNVGPHKDIVGTWAKIARKDGLRFGVSNHSSHAWHWFQVAYGHDVEGPLAGVPYDAATLTKADGKGKWWDGLDPQDLYCGLRIPMPNNLKTAKEADAWHWKHDGHWYEKIPPNDNGYSKKWFLRTQDLIDKYHPDLLYFDDTELPLEQYGLAIAAHYYNASMKWNGGKLDVVLDTKHLEPAHKPAMVEDIERGVANGIRPAPWQTDTCIGSWHYDRRIFEQHKYKTVAQVVQMLVDIVSKNGNLLLSVPIRGNGEIDSDEVAFLHGMAKWMDINGEAIFGTRPWTVYGEGPSTTEPQESGQFGGARDVRSKPYTSEDVRFTTKGNAIYAIFLDWPADHSVVIKSFATGTPASPPLLTREIATVSLLGSKNRLVWSRDAAGLHVALPSVRPGNDAYSLKVVLK